MLYNVIVNGRQEYIREGYVGAIDCVKFYYPEFPLNKLIPGEEVEHNGTKILITSSNEFNDLSNAD